MKALLNSASVQGAGYGGKLSVLSACWTHKKSTFLDPVTHTTTNPNPVLCCQRPAPLHKVPDNFAKLLFQPWCAFMGWGSLVCRTCLFSLKVTNPYGTNTFQWSAKWRELQRQELHFLQHSVAFQNLILLFSYGDTCWQMHTPVTPSGRKINYKTNLD